VRGVIEAATLAFGIAGLFIASFDFLERAFYAIRMKEPILRAVDDQQRAGPRAT